MRTGATASAGVEFRRAMTGLRQRLLTGEGRQRNLGVVTTPPAVARGFRPQDGTFRAHRSGSLELLMQLPEATSQEENRGLSQGLSLAFPIGMYKLGWTPR